jgi:hypothetical protein
LQPGDELQASTIAPHVAAAVAVTEDPLVFPGRVELAIVPGDDPALRLVVMTEAGPFVGELPQVVVEAVK